MSLIEIHARLANTALYYMVIMALWGFWRFFRKQGLDKSYWGAIWIAEGLVLLQAGLGAFLWLSGTGILASGMHILYGVVGILTIPAIFFFTRGDDQRRAILIYGAGLLFMVGILLRAIVTGK